MYRTVIPARRPLPRRQHPLASPRGRWRAAQRLAGGLRPAALARVERAAEAEVDALLARPDFQKLLAACRALEAMPEAERLARLEGLAWFVLEHALAEGDWRCAAFVLMERCRGRNPARTLAQRVMARQARAAKPPAAAEPPTAAKPKAAAAAPATRPNTPFCDRHVEGVLARAGAALGNAVVEEHAARHAAEAEVASPPAAPEVLAAPAACQPRRLDGVAARLRSGAATWVADPQPAPLKGLLRAWAQGP
jgi:hypothetical protein